jgi:anti-sigma regulatory factor (Ser/Thr protein kinase)
MLIDRIGMATAIACFQNGLLYIVLPITGSLIFGFYGMWAGFVVAPAVALTTAMLFVFFRFKKDNFPFLLNNLETNIEVLDGILSPDAAVALSKEVGESLLKHQYPKGEANRAALFVEEIGLTILDNNGNAKKPVLIELSLFFEEDSVLIIERDSGKLFDITNPDVQVRGLSGFILSGLMASHKEKAYLVTTGYNRNMLRFSKNEKIREMNE